MHMTKYRTATTTNSAYQPKPNVSIIPFTKKSKPPTSEMAWPKNMERHTMMTGDFMTLPK